MSQFHMPLSGLPCPFLESLPREVAPYEKLESTYYVQGAVISMLYMAYFI